MDDILEKIVNHRLSFVLIIPKKSYAAIFFLLLLGLREVICEDIDVDVMVVVVFLVTDNTNVAGLSNKLKGSVAVAVLPTLVISQLWLRIFGFRGFRIQRSEFLKF